MKEAHQEIPEYIFITEALSIIEEFRSKAPTRKPNLSEYMSYLNRIEHRLTDPSWKRRTDSKEGFTFFLPGKRLNQINFTHESITWTWDHDGGRKDYPTRKSVKFYVTREIAQMELKKSVRINDSIEIATITMGNGPKVSLNINGEENQIPFEEISSYFSKPK